jgi:hypothetical protein
MPKTTKLLINFDQLARTVASAAVGDGLPRDSQEVLARERGDTPIVVVAAAPKSGSTFLVNTLGRMLGLPNVRLCSAYSTNEHDLYLPALCLVNRNGCISQLHMKGSYHNASLMRMFGIRPLIMVRRIDDIVVSLAHDFRRKAQHPAYGSGLNGYSFVWQDQCIADLSDERLLDMIIALAVPWFVNFYVSWFRLCERHAVDALWVTYEQLIAGKRKTLDEILAFLGGSPSVTVDDQLLEQRYATFRTGGTGEGAAVLTPAQQARLREPFAFYPGVDFAMYGL